jgi:hypothetical protein
VGFPGCGHFLVGVLERSGLRPIEVSNLERAVRMVLMPRIGLRPRSPGKPVINKKTKDKQDHKRNVNTNTHAR